MPTHLLSSYNRPGQILGKHLAGTRPVWFIQFWLCQRLTLLLVFTVLETRPPSGACSVLRLFFSGFALNRKQCLLLSHWVSIFKCWSHVQALFGAHKLPCYLMLETLFSLHYSGSSGSRKNAWLGVVVLTSNPSTSEVEAGRSLKSLRPAWCIDWVPRQPGIHRVTSSQTKQNEKKEGRWRPAGLLQLHSWSWERAVDLKAGCPSKQILTQENKEEDRDEDHFLLEVRIVFYSGW